MHLIYTFEFYLHLASVILIGVATVATIYLISLTGKAWAWLLFCAALVLMAFDRVLQLLSYGGILLDSATYDIASDILYVGMAGCLLGSVYYIRGIFFERKLAEQALRDSEDRFRSISASAQDAIIMLDNVGNISYWNAAAEKIFGYGREEVLGQEMSALLMPARLRDAHGKGFGHFRTTGEGAVIGKVIELVALRKGGEEFPVELSISAVKRANEWCAIGMVRDITERKRAEERLHDSHESLNRLLNSIVEGAYGVDTNGNCTFVNQSSLQMLGYQNNDELLGKHMHTLMHHSHADGSPYPVSECRIYRAYQAIQSINVSDEVFWRKDGSSFPVEYWSSPILIGGVAVGAILTFIDITERKLAEEKIRELNEGLEIKVQERTQQLLQAQEELVRKEKLAVLGQVAGSVGHELRNPLGVMSNAVYFLQTVLADADDSIKEYLNIIKSEIAGSERIVSDLLDSVRTKPPQPEIAGMRELLEQTLRKLVIPSSVAVKLDIPETLSPLRVDAMQIQQVLRNLISNGVEAMPEGGTLEISAVENISNGTVTVSVRDSGTGIAPEVLTKLFQPLFTTKARGIGLGLVVVRNLTQANGGRVQVESEVGKGSVFTVTLPSDNSAVATA